MKLREPNWRGEIERVYALFPRLKERRLQLAGNLDGRLPQAQVHWGRALNAGTALPFSEG